MALVQITLNGTDYSAQITDMSVQVAEQKKALKNVKGETTTNPPRSRAMSSRIQFTFPYQSLTGRNTLKALFDAGSPITLDHAGTLDYKVGTYAPVDYAEVKQKSLDQVIYNVLLTLQEDIPANLKTLQPAAHSDLAFGGVPQTLGF